jgi:hypothetical protein
MWEMGEKNHVRHQPNKCLAPAAAIATRTLTAKANRAGINFNASTSLLLKGKVFLSCAYPTLRTCSWHLSHWQDPLLVLPVPQ